MNRSSCLNIAIIFVLLLQLICLCAHAEQSHTNKDKWQSKHHQVEATLEDGWKNTHINNRGDVYETEDKLLVGFSNKENSLGYMIKIDGDVSKDIVSDDVFYAALKKQFLSSPSNQLVDEGKVKFHGKEYYRLRFIASGGKKGPVNVWLFIYRDGKHCITVQWIFPREKKEKLVAPMALTGFDKSVKIMGK